MKQRRKWAPAAWGILLCAATLAFSIVLQRAGYLTYLNSDMASELILARRQADTHSLVQMDWLYSTEIHTLHMNLFYALAFLFTPDYQAARIIGNTAVFLLGMASCVYLLRKLRVSWGGALACAALLPFSASALYAANMTIGGYYIIHLPFAFLTAGLWLTASEGEGTRRHRRLLTAAYAAMCLLEGFLSVRYVLCFICPMMAVAALHVLLAPAAGMKTDRATLRFGAVTLLGFAACVLGYAASEVIVPRLFMSGVGSADSFVFNPLDGQEMGRTLLTVAADLLKLLGWRGEAALFSAQGMANLCIAGTLLLGGILFKRACAGIARDAGAGRAQRWMLEYALAAALINLFCFVFIKGTYLNRYLILAVLFLVPALGVMLKQEQNIRLRAAFAALLCAGLGLSGMTLMGETRVQEREAEARSADMMDAAAFLQAEGYTHGYGTFWNVRVMQERTQGALTFTAVRLEETEEGAAAPLSPDMIRWLEPDSASDIGICPGKTFLLLTREEQEQAGTWLEMTGAPVVYENGTFAVYGFESSQALVSQTLWGKMKLENAALEEGAFVMSEGGRMRVPTSWREAGDYVLTFDCEGEPAQDSVVQIYTTSGFVLLEEQQVEQGENRVAFTLPGDDKYFMILFKSGGAQRLRLTRLLLSDGQKE